MLNKACKDIVLYHKGELTYDIIGELIGALKEKMIENYANFGLYKKLLTLMIESLENILRYNNHIAEANIHVVKCSPEFLICSEKSRYIVETANIILNRHVQNLQERIDALRKMDPSEIKELYKETITNGKFSEKGGAGLGIIEMAKIVDEKINYSFSPVDEIYSLFKLRLIVHK